MLRFIPIFLFTILFPGNIYIALQMLDKIGVVDSENLELIEVQSGSYLGEDDIVRFEDRYGRVKP